MASQLYPKGAGHLLDILISSTVKILFRSAATVTTNEFVSDLTGIVARSGALAGKSKTNGVFDANDITVTSVSGSAFTHVDEYIDSGSDATSELIAVFDVASFPPSGGDINVVFNASGHFSIA